MRPMRAHRQLLQHRRRADVRQDPVLANDGEGVIAKDVGAEEDNRRLVAHRKAGSLRTQDLVARDGVDPDASLADGFQDLPRRTSLHRVARLDLRGLGNAANGGNSVAQRRCVVEIEGSSHARRDRFEIYLVAPHRWHVCSFSKLVTGCEGLFSSALARSALRAVPWGGIPSPAKGLSIFWIGF